VDHRLPVRDRPDLAFVKDNLQTLCRVCHSRKTQLEINGNHRPDLAAWRALVRAAFDAPKKNPEVEHA
jgi:5-methylcytosine-specific restriction endonuclease McrA